MQLRRLRKTVAVCLVIVLVVLLPSEGMVALATSTADKLKEQQKEKDKLEDQLDETKDELDELKDEQNTLQGELNDLNEKLSQVSENLSSLEQQIRDKEQEIAQTQASLEAAKETESWQYECMLIRVQAMYERGDVEYANAILSKGSLSEMLNAADFYQGIAEYDQKKLQEFKNNRKLIEEQEILLQNEKVELDNLKVAAEAEKSKVSGLISQTTKALSKYKNQISDAEKKAKAYEAELKKAEENLEYLKKKLAEEKALADEAAKGHWRDISEVQFAEGDRYLLANLIYCEAGGEPYAGKLAVGSVVMNRVLSSVYPDTVVGVIYQKRQFSPVASGRLELALAADKATPDCYKAADEAMAGITNVGSCLFFRTPVEGLSGINIGGHVFY